MSNRFSIVEKAHASLSLSPLPLAHVCTRLNFALNLCSVPQKYASVSLRTTVTTASFPAFYFVILNRAKITSPLGTYPLRGFRKCGKRISRISNFSIPLLASRAFPRKGKKKITRIFLIFQSFRE